MARSGIDEQVVDRAMLIQQQVPVPSFEGSVGIADRSSIPQCHENDRFDAPELSPKPPAIASLDIVHQEKAPRILRVVHPDELTGHLADPKKIALVGRTDLDLGNHANILQKNAARVDR
jgi:hypothetical protein